MGKTNKRTRDTRTGRFVLDGAETRRPNTTVREVIDPPSIRRGKVARRVVRDATTGQFLPSGAELERPDTTIVQTILLLSHDLKGNDKIAIVEFIISLCIGLN